MDALPPDLRIAFIGEALIDFTCTNGLNFEGHEGGALANSAIAAARLAQPTAFITQLSTDMFGERLLENLTRNGLDTRFVLRSDAPSTLAFVERTPVTNRYAFYMQGTADTQWAPAQLPVLPDSCRFLHFGSISLLNEPAASRITEFVEAQKGQRMVMFDPNVRLSLIADVAGFRARMQRWVAACDLLKFSDEDAAVLAPGLSLHDAAALFLQPAGQPGPRAVVVTRGGLGATVYRHGREPIDVSAPKVAVVDTIGAGDTFAAALSVSLLEQGVEHTHQLSDLPDESWRQTLRFAVTAAALNCTRAGANPPSRAELRDALSSN
jgi:fructokinase